LNLCEPGGKKIDQKKEERTEQIEKRKKYGKTVNKQKERDKKSENVSKSEKRM
jgi:hypothetical protein